MATQQKLTGKDHVVFMKAPLPKAHLPGERAWARQADTSGQSQPGPPSRIVSGSQLQGD